MSKNSNQPIIQSLYTGIELIELIVNESRPLKFTDIEKLTCMTKSNLHKYLNTFTLKGLLLRDETGTYFLGSKLIEFGNAAIGSFNLIDISSPYLKKISKKVNLTTLLSVWTSTGPVIGNIWNSHIGINIGADIGTKLPALSSAGKIFLALGDHTKIKDWQETKLSSLTKHQQSELKKELETVKDTKFAYAAEPLIEHISSISVPILNYDTDIIGCVTVVGFNTEIPKHLQAPVSETVHTEVTKLSQVFGYRP